MRTLYNGSGHGGVGRGLQYTLIALGISIRLVGPLRFGVLLPVCFATSLAHSLTQVPRVELDHVFIVVKPGAVAEIAALRSAGLTVGPQIAKHDGQGTASVGVLFDNAYLELIWPDSSVSVDPQHAETARWFRKAAAWRTNGQSPFGFGLRRQPGDAAPLPVPVKREPAPWLGPDAAYELLHQSADTLAADFFVVPALGAVPSWVDRRRNRAPELFQHPGRGRVITLVRVHGPLKHQPVAFRALRPRPIEMIDASQPLLELELDNGVRGDRRDLRPILPLTIAR